MRETVIILDFGGQYNQLIARRVRELNVYCELLPYSASYERVMSYNPVGIILTGGPKKCIWGKCAQVRQADLRGRGCRCWASAMERSCWRTPLAGRFLMRPRVNMARPRFPIR